MKRRVDNKAILSFGSSVSTSPNSLEIDRLQRINSESQKKTDRLVIALAAQVLRKSHKKAPI